MNVNGTGTGYETVNKSYADYCAKNTTTDKNTSKTDKVTVQEEAAVFEKTKDDKSTASYSINKMTKEQRASFVEKLKADQESRAKSLLDLVQNMMTKQGQTFAFASDDAMYAFLAKGNYTVDLETKLQAQKDIAEDGYYGVKQTSQRMFDFACALAGDDVEKMKTMQNAIEKGYKQAEKAWGKELPDICKQTLEATNKMFDEYYASK